MKGKKNVSFPFNHHMSYDELCEKAGFDDPVTIYFNGLSRIGRLLDKYMLKFEGCEFIWEGQRRYRVVKWPNKAGKEEA